MLRLQNRIAASRASLPVTAAYSVLLWLAVDAVPNGWYVQFALFAVAVYLMVELNNTNALIRSYSRMVSRSFALLMVMMTFLMPQTKVLGVQLCFILAYALLTHCYQDKRSQGRQFYAFLALGIGSLLWPPVLVYVPVLWILTATRLVAFTFRAFVAALLGLAAPYWLLAAYCLVAGDMALLTNHFAILHLAAPDYSALLADPHRLLALTFVVLLTAVGAVHYLRTSHMDKVRTQMLYEMFTVVTIVTLLALALQPQHIDYLLAILTVHTSIFIAHFIALTATKWSNIAFIAMLLATLALTAYNTLSYGISR